MRLNKLLLFLYLFLMVGCQSNSLSPMTLEEIYPSNLSNVTKIEIRHGGGELKIISDKGVIDDWIAGIKDISFVPDENQEFRAGALYSVKLLEMDNIILIFTTSDINDYYYKPNQVIESIETLFVEN